MTDWNTYSGTENKNGEDFQGMGSLVQQVPHSKSAVKVKPSTFQDLAYTVMNLHVYGLSNRRLLQEEEDGIVLVNPDTHVAASYVLGHVHMGLRV